ncbi:MAG: hypothetical protein K0S80_4495 [Neobacillus sp.]|nr:hypothetical protein [Neobacillus sp.]
MEITLKKVLAIAALATAAFAFAAGVQPDVPKSAQTKEVAIVSDEPPIFYRPGVF